MAAIELPEELIKLERSAWEQIQARTLTVPTALAVHEGIAAFVTESGLARLDVEAELKRQVRYPEATAA